MSGIPTHWLVGNITLGSCTRLMVRQLEGYSPSHRELWTRDSCPGVSSTDIEVKIEVVLQANDERYPKVSTEKCN